MAKMKRVILMEPTDGPGGYTSLKAALAANPKKWGPAAYFPTEEQAKGGARRINTGERDEFPREKYWAAPVPNPSPECEPDEQGLIEDAWFVMVGTRPHIPEGWRKFVDSPGSRKRSQKDNEATSSDVEESEGELFEDDAQEQEPAYAA